MSRYAMRLVRCPAAPADRINIASPAPAALTRDEARHTAANIAKIPQYDEAVWRRE
jgi:hypothetical protein